MTTVSDIAVADDRSTAQFFFEVGYGAAWADAYMQNGKKAAFSISDEAVERAWAIAPEAHEDRDEWDRHMAATNLPPFQIVKENGDGDYAIRSLDIRSPLNRTIYQAIRDFRMGNMCDEDGNGYPLVDLMSNPAPCDIGTGEEQMISLADEVCAAVEAMSPWQPIETAPKDGTKMLRPHIHWGAMAVRHKRPEHTDEFTKGLNWMSVDYSSIWPDDAFLPFWMPLPATPSQIEEGKDNG